MLGGRPSNDQAQLLQYISIKFEFQRLRVLIPEVLLAPESVNFRSKMARNS